MLVILCYQIFIFLLLYYYKYDIIYNALKNLKTSKTFKEDGDENGDGLLHTYDGNPKHMIWISFTTIEEYCKENNLDYFPGENPSTGMDMCIVSKRKEP